MIKKNNFWFKVILFLAVAGVYFFTRLQHLEAIPVFGDEAIYVRWSQIIKNEETLRFIPQTDGKQPLFMWLTSLSLRLVADPLVAGRLVSVLAGFFTLIGIFFVTSIYPSFFEQSFNPANFIKNSLKNNFYLGLLSAIIYIFLPFSFFFDRLAVPDNLLSAFGVWSLFFSLLLAKFRRLDLSLILGMILGLSWLTKSPAIYFIALSFGTFFILNLDNLKSIYLPIISAILAFLIYNILRLGPQFHMIALRNRDYIWPLSEIIKHPFDPFRSHFGSALTIFGQYISWLILFFCLIGLGLYFFYQKNTQLLAILAWAFLPLLANSAMARVFTARYILFILPPLVVLITLGLSVWFSRNFPKIIFILLLLIPNIIWLKNISLTPFEVKLPSTEVGYLSDWTSGWGIKPAADLLKNRAREANVIVGTEGSFGTLPDGLQIYTDSVPQLTVIGQGLGFTQIPSSLTNARQFGDEVYLLINQSRLTLSSLDQDKLVLVQSFAKPDGDKLLLYRLK
jgi:4-amino-4-deoxy-L-arabinose transferase-like glycosyltransferase